MADHTPEELLIDGPWWTPPALVESARPVVGVAMTERGRRIAAAPQRVHAAAPGTACLRTTTGGAVQAWTDEGHPAIEPRGRGGGDRSGRPVRLPPDATPPGRSQPPRPPNSIPTSCELATYALQRPSARPNFVSRMDDRPPRRGGSGPTERETSHTVNESSGIRWRLRRGCRAGRPRVCGLRPRGPATPPGVRRVGGQDFLASGRVVHRGRSHDHREDAKVGQETGALHTDSRYVRTVTPQSKLGRWAAPDDDLPPSFGCAHAQLVERSCTNHRVGQAVVSRRRGAK